MRRPSLRRRVEAAWYDTPSPAAALLAPLGWVYGAVMAVRRLAYRLGVLPSFRVPVPVIVVGNITAGGTGKTPVVAWLVGEAQSLGFRPGIVSRGYGGTAGRGPRRVAADAAAAETGDEPLLLARQTAVPVCIGSDRVAAAQALVAAGCDLIVADDGLQHLRLRRDAEVVVVDGARLAGNGRRLPAGPLREPWSRLASVDLVLVNGAAAREPHFPVPALCHGFALVPGDAEQFAGAGRRPLASFAGRRVYALAGIGNPERFRRTLAAEGLQPELLAVDDHGRAGGDELARATGMPLLMTMKDAVKYAPADRPAGAEWWQVPVRLEPSPAARAALLRLLQRCRREGAGAGGDGVR
jgi:tetraacyldisaccharide 4'-kinase